MAVMKLPVEVTEHLTDRVEAPGVLGRGVAVGQAVDDGGEVGEQQLRPGQGDGAGQVAVLVAGELPDAAAGTAASSRASARVRLSRSVRAVTTHRRG